MDTNALATLLRSLAAAPGRALAPAERALLEESVREYPYFAPPFYELALRSPQGAPETAGLRARAAIRALGHPDFDNAVEGGEWLGFYPPEETAPSPGTEETIDTFLRTYGHTSPEEEELLNKLIFNPVPDYAEMLAREEQENLPESEEGASDDSPEARINAFILEKHPAAKPRHEERDPSLPPPYVADTPVAPQSEPHDDSLLSESLAKIYIRQGRYERAYEIISGLNLKFPKKSVYFADQLRFLKKLIINQRAKSKNQASSEGASAPGEI